MGRTKKAMLEEMDRESKREDIDEIDWDNPIGY
jgi:hypothetical protein